jgi:hypothetical protein
MISNNYSLPSLGHRVGDEKKGLFDACILHTNTASYSNNDDDDDDDDVDAMEGIISIHCKEPFTNA